MHAVLDAGYGIHFNSDGSGEALIIGPEGEQQARIPFSLLVKAVAYVVRAEKISALEQASDEEIVGLE